MESLGHIIRIKSDLSVTATIITSRNIEKNILSVTLLLLAECKHFTLQ